MKPEIIIRNRYTQAPIIRGQFTEKEHTFYQAVQNQLSLVDADLLDLLLDHRRMLALGYPAKLLVGIHLTGCTLSGK